MADRHFRVRPRLEQLEAQAEELLRAIREGNAELGRYPRRSVGSKRGGV